VSASSRTTPAPSSQNESSARAVRSSDFVIPSSFPLVHVLQFRVQPYLGKFPVTPHGYARNFEHFCYLVVAQSAKKFQLDYLSLSRVECRQLFQRLMKLDNFF